jgi:hypothetical protein
MTDDAKTITILPAAPGWYVRLLVKDKIGAGSIGLTYEPIIAWEIRRATCEAVDGGKYIWRDVIPILIDSPCDQLFVIQGPDGRCIIPEDCTFENEAAALEHFGTKKEGSGMTLAAFCEGT